MRAAAAAADDASSSAAIVVTRDKCGMGSGRGSSGKISCDLACGNVVLASPLPLVYTFPVTWVL